MFLPYTSLLKEAKQVLRGISPPDLRNIKDVKEVEMPLNIGYLSDMAAEQNLSGDYLLMWQDVMTTPVPLNTSSDPCRPENRSPVSLIGNATICGRVGRADHIYIQESR